MDSQNTKHKMNSKLKTQSSNTKRAAPKLPIGFRFCPTNEEVLLHYLIRKIYSLPLLATVITQLDAFNFNPWDLPGDLKEKRYFFSKRNKNVMSNCSSFNASCGRGIKTIMVFVGSKLNGLCINIAFWFHPSAEDEVNVACFHPSAEGGLVYGTKEGKLRILCCDLSHSFKHEGSCFPDENMFKVPSYALEG